MTTANKQLSSSGSESCRVIQGGKLDALTNVLSHQSFMNYKAIFEGFVEKGLAIDDIKPRENVFTFNAWKQLGRCVKKGEHGVRVCTFTPVTKKDKTSGEVTAFRMPRQTTVFHLSQTEPLHS